MYYIRYMNKIQGYQGYLVLRFLDIFYHIRD